jgi:hypothetical protein
VSDCRAVALLPGCGGTAISTAVQGVVAVEGEVRHEEVLRTSLEDAPAQRLGTEEPVEAGGSQRPLVENLA